jgi:hypothetical protein
MNGELNQAGESLLRALDEIKKLYEKGEVRLTKQEVLIKRSSLAKVVELAIECSAYLGRFEMIANQNENSKLV